MKSELIRVEVFAQSELQYFRIERRRECESEVFIQDGGWGVQGWRVGWGVQGWRVQPS